MERLHGKPGETVSYVVLFDGHCPFCRAQAGRLARWSDRGVVIETRDFQEPGVLDAYPTLTHEQCMASMQLVGPDGHVWSGAEAVARLLMTRPFGLFAWLYYVPLLRWICDLAYRFVAKRRYRIAQRKRTIHCDGTTCSVHFT